MITKFKLFEKVNPEIDEKTIRVENKEREWYIDFYFDDKGRLDYIDNKWDVRIPDWYYSNVSFMEIKIWAKKYDPKCDVFYVIKEETDKYNL